MKINETIWKGTDKRTQNVIGVKSHRFDWSIAPLAFYFIFALRTEKRTGAIEDIISVDQYRWSSFSSLHTYHLVIKKCWREQSVIRNNLCSSSSPGNIFIERDIFLVDRRYSAVSLEAPGSILGTAVILMFIY